MTKRDPDGRPEFVHIVGLFAGEQNGRWRLYLSPRLDCWAEFNASDVVEYRQVACDALVPGYESTCVVLKRSADIRFTWSETVEADDQLDLDVHMSAGRSQPPHIIPFRTMRPLSSTCPRTMCNQ